MDMGTKLTAQDMADRIYSVLEGDNQESVEFGGTTPAGLIDHMEDPQPAGDGAWFDMRMGDGTEFVVMVVRKR